MGVPRGGHAPVVPAVDVFALETAGNWAAAAWDALCPYDTALARLAGDPPALCPPASGAGPKMASLAELNELLAAAS